MLPSSLKFLHSLLTLDIVTIMARILVLSIERLSSDALIGFVVGFFFAILLAVLFSLLFLNKPNLYDLDHWKLNVDVPFESMWMNMGYWYLFHPFLSSSVMLSFVAINF